MNNRFNFNSRKGSEHRKRYLLGTFFIACNKVAVIYFITGLLFSSGLWAGNCALSAQQISNAQKTKVDKVIDGDTVRLSNGRLVRFIGINTPEIDHKFGNSEPFAIEARDYLQAKITRSNGEVLLVAGPETEDRHGRLLAHVFSPRGENIQADILLEGYGAWIVVPPNLEYLDCYRDSEKQARGKKKGVWGKQFKTPRNVQDLTKADRGFQWIQGKISRIGSGKKYWWLSFEDDSPAEKYSKVALRVRRDDLQYFNERSLDHLVGKVVRVKGWLSQYRDQLVMSLKHPASLEIVD